MTDAAAKTSVSSPFYAYLSRLRWIKRWGLKRNAHEENVMEHSWEVPVIAHTLALIKNRYYGGSLDSNAIATAALYHDITEVITGGFADTDQISFRSDQHRLQADRKAGRKGALEAAAARTAGRFRGAAPPTVSRWH